MDDCLERLKNDDRLAVAGSRQHISNSASYSEDEIYCFERRENILSYQHSLIMRKGFELTSRFNELIRNAFEGGLFVQWERVNQRKRKLIIEPEPSLPLTLEHLGVPFAFILFVGMSLGTFAFIAELMIFRKMEKPDRHWIWPYLEQFFDGERHYMKDLAYSELDAKTKRNSRINRKLKMKLKFKKANCIRKKQNISSRKVNTKIAFRRSCGFLMK